MALGEERLVASAKEAMLNSYAPYSKLKVGAAILSTSGRIFTGSNVENVSYGLAVCAERLAIFSAVTAGERRFKAIAIVSTSRNPILPCGACRQVMAEFVANLDIFMVGSRGKIKKATLDKLLPLAFTYKKV